MSALRRPPLALLLALVAMGAIPSHATAATPRVVNGSNAPADGSYNPVGNIVIAQALGCTGTLIAPRWVLTAGHCGSPTGEVTGTPIPFPPGSISVTLGTTKADGTGGTSYIVDEVDLPSGYLATSGYDESLMHLAGPSSDPLGLLSFTGVPSTVAKPIQVAGKGFESLWKPNVLETIAGYGTLASDGDTPDTLQVAQVPIIPDGTCAPAYPSSATDPGFLADTEICAAYPGGGTDTCQGDSGGPMFGDTTTGLRMIVATTSYGQGCADKDFPGVYARASDTKLLEWIRSVVPEGVRDRVACESATPKLVYDPSKNPIGPAGATSPGTPTATASCPVTTGAPTATGTSGTGASTPATGGASSGTGGSTAPGTSPAGPAGATGVPAAATTARTVAPAFTSSVAVDRTLRRTVATKGLRVRLRCSAACTMTTTISVDAATAKALKLKSRVVGRARKQFTAAGRTTQLVRLERTVAKAVTARSSAVLSLQTAISYAGGTRTVARPVKLAGTA